MVVVAEPKAKVVKGEHCSACLNLLVGCLVATLRCLSMLPTSTVARPQGIPAQVPMLTAPPPPSPPCPPGDFLVRHIARFEEIMRDLEAMKPVPQQPPAAPVAAH